MDKAKTLKKQKKRSAVVKISQLEVHDPFAKELADVKLIKNAILQALVDCDLEAVRDLLIAHLRTINKTKLASKSKLGRHTIYDIINKDKEFNPSIKTLTSILDHLAA